MNIRIDEFVGIIADILKHTAKSNPDSRKLDEALKAIKEVMTHINEDKRKTEGQLAMFDIFNDIDNCPVSTKDFHASNQIFSNLTSTHSPI